MEQFIKKEVDKFKDKTTTRTMPKMFSFNNYLGAPELNLRHISLGDGSEALLIDVTYIGKDWVFLRNGELIINFNDSINVNLKANESYSIVLKGQGQVKESVYYFISKNVLKDICDAEKIDLRLSADSTVHNLSHEDEAYNFQNYCRKFYNEFYGGNYTVTEYKYKGCLANFIFILIGVTSLMLCL